MRISVLTLAAALAAVAIAALPAAAQRGCTGSNDVGLAISMDPITVTPGGSAPVGVFWFVTYAPPDEVPARCGIRWSVEPRGAARVSHGKLFVPAKARPGSEFTLVARVGRRTARQTVRVVDPRPNPLAGYWSQADSAECTGGAVGPRPEPIRELIIRRDSTFSLTAVPFETRRDYWGAYSYDASTGALRFRVEHGNDEPRDGGLEGVARVDGNRLRLEGFWLGDPVQERGGRTCAYVFTRRP